MQLIVDNLSVNYEASGGGPCLLLIHGWGDSQKTYDGLRADLSKEYQVVSVDLPGFGATQAPKEVWGLEEYALFLTHFSNKLGLKPFALVAHSNGASVALTAVARGLLVPSYLVLLGAAGIRDKEKAKKYALRAVAKAGKAATFWLPARQKKNLQKRFYGAAGSDMWVAPHLQETFKKTVAQDVQELASRVQQPTLLIYGEDDRATPPMYGEVYASRMPHAQLEVISRAGHFVHHDQRDKVCKLIRGFLS